jgi:sulfate adenylyltransferase
MFFDHTFSVASVMAWLDQDLPTRSEHHVALSGTRVREMLERGELPPSEFTRPEVAEVLISSLRQSAQAA